MTSKLNALSDKTKQREDYLSFAFDINKVALSLRQITVSEQITPKPMDSFVSLSRAMYGKRTFKKQQDRQTKRSSGYSVCGFLSHW